MLETISLVVVAIILGIPAGQNLIGPLIIWKTQRLPARCRFEPVDDSVLFRHATPRFFEYHRAIARHGFRSAGASMTSDSHSNSYFRLYWHPDLRTAAMIVTTGGNHGGITYVEFTQRFDDGSVLDVSNAPHPGAFPALVFKTVFQFSEMLEPRELLIASLRLKTLLKAGRRVRGFDASRGLEEVEAFIGEESDAMVEKGVVKSEIDSDGKRALTLYGAFIVTWRSIFPGKNILARVTGQNSRRALERAGRVPEPHLPPATENRQEVLSATVEGCIDFIEAMGDDADHMIVFVDAWGDLPLFTSAELFDAMGLKEGQHVRLNVELRSNPYIGENQRWITSRVE